MKICLIELMPFPYTLGGGTTHIMNLGKALSELGNEVHVISSKPAKEYKKLKYYNKINIYNVGLRHKKFEGSGMFYYLYRLLFELAFVFSARKKIREIKPNIIDCQSSITTALPASLSGYPFVISCHGIHSQGFEKLYTSKGKAFAAKILNKIYFAITRYNVKKAGKLISQGKTTLNYYSNIANDKSKEVLVPNLVDSDFWGYNPEKDNKMIVAVARFTKQKALDKLIEAMKYLKDYRLVIIGQGELEKELKKIAGKNVKFIGYLPPEKCLTFYKKARFTILPSEFEGLPYTILESMSCGVIPITTKVGELPVLIKNGKNGFLLDNNKPKIIAEAIRKAGKSNMKKIAENARKTIVDNYSSGQVAKVFLKAYKDASKKP